MCTITGFVIEVFPAKPVKNRRYRKFWIQTNTHNPQAIAFQVANGQCEQLDELNRNDLVEVKYIIHGRIQTKKDTGEKVLYNNNIAEEVLIIEKD